MNPIKASSYFCSETQRLIDVLIQPNLDYIMLRTKAVVEKPHLFSLVMELALIGDELIPISSCSLCLTALFCKNNNNTVITHLI